MIPSPANVDEGFSEDTRSQPDTEHMYAVNPHDDSVARLLQLALAMPAKDRKYFTQELVYSLCNADKEAVKVLIESLTHFDPVNYFPNEIVLHIFSFLSPKDLLAASVVSRAWRTRAHDERLWQCCFACEGWVLDPSRTRDFERSAGEKYARLAHGKMTRPSSLGRRGSRKRKTEEAFSDGDGNVALDEATMQVDERTGPVQQDTVSAAGDHMEGVESTNIPDESNFDVSGLILGTSEFDTRSVSRHLSTSSIRSGQSKSLDFKLSPTLFQDPYSSTPKLSWPYLYKQRRRLETNWDRGQYRMFQIPHPDFPEEGHDECVYTIQHSSRHLVSGSRDQTIRIWDLGSYRLKGKPLRGHEASVLCLQFDERPDQDIIVSGGSDAYVIVWKFSTGKILKKMTNAHEESVLNLRFNDHYIVTCSKDKTIKIWNRRALTRDDPILPSHTVANFDKLDFSAGEMIKEFSLLTTLTGHHAAVNAVMIHEGIIVSASGDRTIKSWDIDTGKLKKTYVGHTKGIACVQFDGRRIVSGSSDNTVRIFDAAQQAEIACLSGHQHLVRTVQARFGDLDTTTNEELENQAHAADRAFFAALSRGMTPAGMSRRYHRNQGSSKPDDMIAVGTKVPPGGGGSRWAKIVSGSYDETVILWKRDWEGKWQPKLRLHQDMLLRASRNRRHVLASTLPQPANLNAISAQAGQAAPVQPHQNAQPQPQNQQVATAATDPSDPQTAQYVAAAQSTLGMVNAFLHQPPGTGAASSAQVASVLNAQNTLHTYLAEAAHAHASTNQNPGQQQQQQQQQSQPQQQTSNPHQPPLTTHNNPALAVAAAQHQQHQHQHQHQPAQQVAMAAHRESNRVFKLQFDARRIICCSQNKIIVGWDFANGDQDLERIGEWSVETS